MLRSRYRNGVGNIAEEKASIFSLISLSTSCGVRSFARTELATTIYHEWLSEAYWEYSLARTDNLIRFWRSRSQQTIKVESYEHHISWTTWAISVKLTGNNHGPLLMTWWDFGVGERTQTGGQVCCGKGINVDAGALKTIF